MASLRRLAERLLVVAALCLGKPTPVHKAAPAAHDACDDAPPLVSFAGAFTAEAGFAVRPRANFDSFTQAALSVFTLMTGDGWSAVMYDAKGAAGWLAVPYVVAVVLLGECQAVQY